jgi:hypothetical protein
VSTGDKVVSTDGTISLTGLGGPTSMVIRTMNGTRYLYVACATAYRIRAFRIDTTPITEDTSQTIGTGTVSPSIVNTYIAEKTAVQLLGPTGLALDAANNLYVVDQLAHKVYIVPPDPSLTVPAKVYWLAGTGTAGNTTDLTQPGTATALNTPTCCIFHERSGNLLFTDTNNGSIRRIKLNAIPTLTSFTERSVAPIYPTTTAPKGQEPMLITPAVIQQNPYTDRETITEYKQAAILEMI